MRNRIIEKQNIYNIRYLIVPLFVAAAMFFVWAPGAEANIAVEGDAEFVGDVNECLSRYRNAEGLISDVIRELEGSENTHNITEGNDWANTPSNGDAAFDGTGTETKVSKEELERKKERIPGLQNKDFCTALLHELWHAVEADRGEWSDDRENGVYEDEIQAVIFQNFMHAIRGVDPRTTYGGNDISTLVGVSTTPTPILTPAPTPTPTSPAEEIGGGEETAPAVEMGYEHVAPGQYSEVYVTVMIRPGATVQATLSGPGVSGDSDQTQTADSEGAARFTWRIVSYGSYTVEGTADGSGFRSTVTVQ